MNSRIAQVCGELLLVLCLVISPGLVAARTVWQAGIVTRAPWVDRYTHIEISGNDYTLMPKARILHQEQGRSGEFLEKRAALTDLWRGRQIKMRIQGRRIYEVLIL